MMNEKQLCILLVDDDDTGNYISKKIITRTFPGSHIHTAYNGLEALDFMNAHCEEIRENYCPDLILLDINMPVMDGFEFLNAYQQSSLYTKSTTQIVILSSSDNAQDIEMAGRFNIKGYITKPITVEKVKEVILH